MRVKKSPAKKRFMAGLLAAVMALTTLPGSVFATEGERASSVQAVSSGTGNLPGGHIYQMETECSKNGKYLIVNKDSGNAQAMSHVVNNGNHAIGSTAVQITGSGSQSQIILDNDTNIAWSFQYQGSNEAGWLGSANHADVFDLGNQGWYLAGNAWYEQIWLTNDMNNQDAEIRVGHIHAGSSRTRHQITAYDRWENAGNHYYLTYNESAGTWGTVPNSAKDVFLYRYAGSSNGEPVEFSITPKTLDLVTNAVASLNGVVTVNGAACELSRCDVTYVSNDPSIAKVDASTGTVTSMAVGETYITATLTAVDGQALVSPIVLTIPVTVENALPDHVSFRVVFHDTTVPLGKGDVQTMTGKVYVDVKESGDENAAVLRTIEHPLSDCTFEWSVPDNSVPAGTTTVAARNEIVSVTNSGAVIGRGAGTTTVFARLISVGGVTLPNPVQAPDIAVTVTDKPDGVVAGIGYLHGNHIYLLDDDCIDDNSRYLIVNTDVLGNAWVLTNEPGSDGVAIGIHATPVTIVEGADGTPKIVMQNDEKIAWDFEYAGGDKPEEVQTGVHSEYYIKNAGQYLYAAGSPASLSMSGEKDKMHVVHKHDEGTNTGTTGEYQIHPWHTGTEIAWHLNYLPGENGAAGGFLPGSDPQYLYLFEHTGYENGSRVTFTLSPDEKQLRYNETVQLLPTIVLTDSNKDETQVSLENCTIEWISSNPDVATVVETKNADGKVTSVAVKADDNTYGMTEITARLTAVNGVQLQLPVILNIPVTVQRAYPVKDGYELHNNDPVVVEYVDGGHKAAPDLSKVHLKVTYDDGRTVAIYQDMIIENPESGNEVYFSQTNPNNGKPWYSYTGPFLTIDYTGKEAPGYHYLEVLFRGDTYGGVVMHVDANPYAGLEPATHYPEYPEPGAVRIDKTGTEINFNTTGVANVELTVAGTSIRPAVDVILVSDASNSMAWQPGMNEATSQNNATAYNKTKMYALAQSVSTFADVLLAPNEHGEPSNNTISLVTFGGYDKEHTKQQYSYADVTRTLLVGATRAEAVKQAIGNVRVLHHNSQTLSGRNDLYNNSSTRYYISFDGGRSYEENYGNTNYDFAFMQTAAAINALKQEYKAEHKQDYDESGRQIYVLFMTDGAPTHYDGEHYKNSSNAASSNATWTDVNGGVHDYVLHDYGSAEKKETTGKESWYNFIAGGSHRNGTVPGNDLYWAKQVYSTVGVVDIFGIGFDIVNGGFGGWNFTPNQYDSQNGGYPLIPVLENMVQVRDVDDVDNDGNRWEMIPALEVFEATDANGLNSIYSQLATKIRYAGTRANVTDIIDPEFTLQMAAKSGTLAGQQVELSDHGISQVKIEVRGYKLWTKEEIEGHNRANPNDLIDENLIGMRKEYEDGVLLKEVLTRKDPKKTYTYEYEVLETVTFNAEGTEAYSNLIIGNTGAKNILGDRGDNDENTIIIDAHHFTYNRIWDDSSKQYGEVFDWHIGNITETEVALNYFVYLKGSLEGEEPAGVRPTNEEAYLEYIDIEGKYAKQIYPIPKTVWKGASTAYEFYLVNEAGQPVNRQGQVIPFANRVIVAGPYYEELYLNAGNSYQANSTVYAKDVVPLGYELYDRNAAYTVHTSSGDNDWDGLTINHPSAASGLAKTTVEVSHTENYIQSLVAFAVVLNENDFTDLFFDVNPDRVVVDYGKPILIDILDNEPARYESVNPDTKVTKYYASGVIMGFTRYLDLKDFDRSFAYNANTSAASYRTGAGQFELVTVNDRQMVKFTPRAFVEQPQQVFCVIEVINQSNTTEVLYMVNPLTVIPATTMYYETDFANGVFNLTGEWDSVSDNKDAAGEVTETRTDGTVMVRDDRFQDDGRIGQERLDFYASQSEIREPVQAYGYDSSYVDDAMYSDGDSLVVNCPAKIQQVPVLDENGAPVVDAQGNAVTEPVYDSTPSAAAQFVFTGTGFEIISRTGVNEGLIRVDIEEDSGEDFRDLKSVSVLNKSQSNLELYQIPVISVNDLPYNTYRITINVFPAFDGPIEALDRAGQFHFDALRIFDPAKGNAIAEQAYDEDAEAQRVLTEVRSVLLDNEHFGTNFGMNDGEFGGVTLNPAQLAGVVFVDSTYSGALPNYDVVEGENGKSTLVEDKENGFAADGIAVWYTDNNGTLYYGSPDYKAGHATVGQYKIIGPNNEVYLEPGQAIAFKVTVDDPAGYKLASFDVGAKSITPNAVATKEGLQIPANSKAVMNVLLTNSISSGAKPVKVAEITSATAQNYDLMNINRSLNDGKAYVVITNTGTGVLSITDIKAAFTSTDSAVAKFYAAPASVEFTVDSDTLALAYRALNND